MEFFFPIIRIVLILIIVRLVTRALFRPAQAKRGPARPRSVERPGGTLVRDPQCGTYLPESRAIAVGRGADALHFCSTACRDAYQAAALKAPRPSSRTS